MIPDLRFMILNDLHFMNQVTLRYLRTLKLHDVQWFLNMIFYLWLISFDGL